MSPDRTARWPITWIALPVAPSIYYLIQEVTTSSTFASVSNFFRVPLCTRDYLLPNGRTIEHRLNRTSHTSNIDYIEHWLHQTSHTSNIDHIKHRTYRTSITSNIEYIEHRSNRTRPYDPWPYDQPTTNQIKNVKIRFCQDANWTLPDLSKS